VETPDDENEKLNYLIDEYRKENDKCSKKIHELQGKLQTTQSRFNSRTVGMQETQSTGSRPTAQASG